MSVLGVDINIHHARYPKKSYRGNDVSNEFRNLHCQRILTPVDEHVELHCTTPPPPVPSRDEMLAHINRCRNNGCTSQGCTQPIPLALREVPVGVSLPREVKLVTLLP